jgi:hypothetical protein
MFVFIFFCIEKITDKEFVRVNIKIYARKGKKNLDGILFISIFAIIVLSL